MRLFIIPSWCPNAENPLLGSFFIEQANTLAKLRPDWKIALCCADLQGSYVPKRAKSWLGFSKRFFSHATMSVEKKISGLLYYKTFRPYAFFSRRCHDRQLNAMLQMLKPALEDFISRHGKPDLLHAQASFPAGAAAVRLGAALDIPVAITEHMGPFPWPSHYTSDGRVIPQIIEAFAGSALVSAVSSSLAKQIKDLALPNSSNICVIPNFVDESIFRPTLAKPTQNSQLSFISVGWPSTEKGTRILLEAFAKLDVPATLSIVGDSPNIYNFMKKATELRIQNKIIWHGNVPRDVMPSLYQAADIFVLPSQYETFGISYLEAIACGKPVIATRCGGPEDFVDKSNGVLVAVDDKNALAAAMQNMATNINLYDTTTIRNHFLAHFSSSAVVEKLDIWYHSALNNT